MMLIPSLSVETNSADTVQASFFPANNYYASCASGDLVFGVTSSPASAVNRLARAYRSTEDRMLATKMQSDLPGFHMYAAAAVATGQPVSSALNSSANYAVAAAPAPTHSLVPPHYGPSAIDASSYYSPLGSGYDIKANDMWAGGYGQAAAPYYQYDAGFAPQYSYDRYCNVDMNDGVRRKNATRESTNTLKAWLQEHKKNPYPTKGEKIMLAIITKMTLTQVSTWFANARRRLKKENKMTWVPKNRANETGSGTDERRASDEKDTDEKTEDEECKSEKNDDDQRDEDTKLTSKPDSSCQYTQEGTTDIPFPTVQGNGEINQYSTENNALSAKSGEEYSHPLPTQHSCDNAEMMSVSAGANSTLDEKGRYRYDLASSAYGRSIWSPVDVHTPRSGSTISRTCNQNYTSDYYYQSGYHQEPHQLHTRRLSATHPHPHHGEYEGLHLARQASLPNSQECLSVGNQPSSSFSSSKHTSPTPPGNRDASEVLASMNLADAARGNDYNLTSPVTNLRNWVNGVFPGVEYDTGVGSQALVRDKGTSGGMNESPKQPDASDTNQGNYQELGYSHLHLPRRSSMAFSKSLSVGGNMGEGFMLQHRSPGIDHTRYYREASSQRTGLAYPHHPTAENIQPDRVSAYPGPAETNYDQSGSGIGGGASLCPSASNFSQSYSLGGTTSMAMGARGTQLAECSASRDVAPHNTSRFPATHCENASSDHDSAVCQGLSHYGPQATKPSTVPLSTAPPPPYAIQCKYAHNAAQSIAYMDNQPCSEYSLKVGSGTQLPFGHVGHPTQRIASPKNSHAGSTADEESNYSCKISPGVEAMKLRPIHDQEAPPDSTAEP